MFGQHAPTDPVVEFAARIAQLSARLAELEREASRAIADLAVGGNLAVTGDLSAANFTPQLVEAFVFAPAGNTDNSTVGFTTWLSIGNFTPPAWATTLTVQMNLTGIQDATAANNIHTLRVTFGSDISGQQVRAHGVGIAQRYNIAWTATLTLSDTAVHGLVVQALRVAGTGVLRADTAADATGLLIWS